MKTNLTWVEDPKRQNGGRWRKKYQGRIFYSAQPNTKPGKTLAIEEFTHWQAKIDEQIQSDKPYKSDYEEAISLRKDMLTWLAIQQNHDPIKKRLLSEIKVLETEFSKPKPKDVNATGVLLDPLHRSHMSMDDILAWLDRLESLRLYKQATLASTDDSLQEQISDYLETQRKRAKLGQIKMSTFKAYQERTEPFQNWLKINNRTQINTAVVRDYQTYIVEEISESRISEQWGCHLRKQANSVIHYLARNELCTLPANLNDPVLTIQVADKEITPLSDAEIKIILNNSPERTKLYALLMLNCGMLPTDIADLKQTEYNGTHITRKRSKTGKKKKGKKNQVPTVSWKLWNSTRQLLDKYRSDHAEYLLLNQGGQPLMKKAIRKDGKVSITSNIKSCWSRLQKKMKRKGIIVRPLEQLRKTGACKLEDNIAYARYSQFFLGQAPSGITEKRYAPPSKQIFDEAMTWLGQQFNL